MQSILIVDDLEAIHEMLEAVIQPNGYNTVFATDGQVALEKLRENAYDIVLTDIRMEPMDGMTLLKEIKAIDPDIMVIMMSGFANVENATEALKFGAFDFLTKPFKVDQLMKSINRASEERKKRREARVESGTDHAGILTGQSAIAQKLKQSIDRHSNAKTPLLIAGEAGTRKSTIASIVHGSGEDPDLPFVAIDSSVLNENEFYSQLFTPDGSQSDKVESARGGTLFIANIDRLAPKNQVTLGNLIRDLKGTTRVVCSTSRDLEHLVEAGEFEDALFFRVSSSVIEVPTLRERSEDMSAIIMSHFGEKNRSEINVEDSANALLRTYRWPGNYAELKEVLDAAIVAAGSGNVIRDSHLPEKLSDISAWPTLEEFIETQSAHYRNQVLKACQGDRARAAEILGCDL